MSDALVVRESGAVESGWARSAVLEITSLSFSKASLVKRALITAEQVRHWLDTARAIGDETSVVVDQAKESTELLVGTWTRIVFRGLDFVW